jgi:hypothetical protein
MQNIWDRAVEAAKPTISRVSESGKQLVNRISQKGTPLEQQFIRGKKDQFDGGKYSVNNYMYPSDLMSDDNRYGGHYVIFYINIATDSKLAKSLTEQDFVADFPARDRGDLIAQKFTGGATGSLVGANATLNTIAGAAGGGLLSGNIGGAAKGAAIANISTVGLMAAATMAPDAVRSQKRLKTAIAMHVPNQLQIRYGVTYSEEDTAGLAMAQAGVGEIMKALDKDKKADVTGVGQAIIANLALSKGPNAGANSAALGLAANPKKEQVFKGVDFRTFSFDYQFYPRNSDESNNVLRIIQEFKYHMHPEFKDTNNFIYIYPSEFDIFYYTGGSENLNLHRHTSCVLTEMSVNYTPNGNFTTFPDGMPTQINITLQFRELALLTKDKIKDGL